MNARERLADLISAAGISQAEVARRVGENPQWVNNRLRGEADIKADDLPRLAAALRVSPSAFFQQSSLAEVVLATFLRILAEMPREYRDELWELASRMGAPAAQGRTPAGPESTSTDDAWAALPEAEKRFILDILEARRST